MSFHMIFVVLLLAVPTWAFVPSPAMSSRRDATTTTSRLFSTVELPEGLLKTVSREGTGAPLKLGDVASVRYSCYLADGNSPPFAKSDFQKVSVGDGAMIDGWEKVIRTMNVGERAVVRITDPSLAYGAVGVPPLIPPNAEIELDMEILDSQPPIDAIDFDTLAVSDRMTPRTASSIAAAYEERQQQKALEPQKEGLEGFLEKVRNFYFFGFFEGETGQRAPWYLRPSITFPLAFLLVGATFYVSILGGAVYERGAQVTDELDEIILTNLVLTTQQQAGVLKALFLPGSVPDL